jgi:nucleoside 2-deoxyribosyltransferase
LSTTNPKPILPPTLNHWFTLGFTGHRELAKPELVKQKLREYLTDLQAEHGHLATVSSAASGADTLFLEVAEELGLPSAIVLPFNKEKFQEDFTDDEWQRAKQQIEQAIERRVVEPCETKEEAYLEATVQTVERCDLLLAVFDPKRPQGNGGTADAVNYARVHNKPVVILNPDTGELHIEGNAPKAKNAPKLKTDPKVQVLASLDYFDNLAMKNAPRARWIAIGVILLHLLATAIAIVGTVVHPTGFAAILIGGFKVTALAIAWVLVIKLHRHHHDWLNARPAAELCRHILSIWHLQRRPLSLKWTVGEGFNPLIRALIIAWQLDKSAALELDAAKKAYLEDRVENQLKHYEKKQRNPTLLVKFTQYSTVPLTVFAIIGAVIAMIHVVALNVVPGNIIGDVIAKIHVGEFANSAAKLTSMLLPLLVAAMLSVAASLDSPRRHQRYGLMADKLRNAKKTIEAAQTWPSLWRAVDNIEYELLNEVEEWHSLSRFSSSH